MYLRNNRISKSILYGVHKPLYPYEQDYLQYPIFNVFGHDHFKEPWMTEHFCGIDTGCVYGGSLSALDIHLKEFSLKNALVDVPIFTSIDAIGL